MGGEGKTKTTPSRCERARDEYVMASLCDAHAGGSKSDDPHTLAKKVSKRSRRNDPGKRLNKVKGFFA